jgi:hypothetical protein
MTVLSCPGCHAPCHTGAAAASLAGKRLRCPHCDHVWRRPESGPAPAPAERALVPIAAIEAPGAGRQILPGDRFGRALRPHRPIIDIYPEPARSRRRPAASLRPTSRFDISGIAACLLAALLVVSAIGFRGAIVAAVPSLGGLYALAGLPVNLSGLEFSEVRIAHDARSGRELLVVAGRITNISDAMVDIPAIRLALQTDARQEVYSWLVEPTRTELEPGASLGFRSRLAPPARTASAVELRFAERRQQLARIR